MKDVCEHCKILNRCVKAYAVAGYPPCSQKSKESRPTVRAKRPVQQRKHVICEDASHACNHQIFTQVKCGFNGICAHKRHAIA